MMRAILTRWLGSMLLALACPMLAHAQGLMLPGTGANHRSMGGASTALATDAAGALYWNPATIGRLPSSEVVIGAEMLMPYAHLGSTVPAGAFGILGPATTQSGNTFSDATLTPLSSVAVVYHADDVFTFGLGMATVAGGGVNYPGDPNNPLLASKGPLKQFILGPQAASIMILQMTPTVSARLTDRLTAGVSPMVDVAVTSFDPAFFGPTTQARLIDPKVFPSGSHTNPFWGGGFRVGMTYQVTEALHAGFSYTSEQWFQTWRFNARNAVGDPLNFSTPFTLPQIFSLGLAYDGIDGLLLAADVRYFDYEHTDLLGTNPINGGAGWESIWSVALGGRYRVTDRLFAQAGYVYNQNPIPSNLVLFNTQLPTINQHTLSVGGYFQLNDSIGMSLAYMHGFKNTVTGSLIQALGTSVTMDTAYDSVAFNLHIRFGASPAAN